MDNTLIKKIGKLGVKILVGGGINYLLNITLTFILSDFLNLHYLLAFSITQVILTLYSFIYNSKLIFKASMTVSKLVRYVFVVVTIAGINIFLVRFFTETISLYYLASISVVLTITVSLKYLFYWLFVFNTLSYRRLLTIIKKL